MDFKPLASFIKGVYSDNGQPSSSRVLGHILSVGSLGILAAIVHHMTTVDAAKLQIWISNLPIIIGSLTAFSTSPYAINTIGNVFVKKDSQ